MPRSHQGRRSNRSAIRSDKSPFAKSSARTGTTGSRTDTADTVRLAMASRFSEQCLRMARAREIGIQGCWKAIFLVVLSAGACHNSRQSDVVTSTTHPENWCGKSGPIVQTPKNREQLGAARRSSFFESVRCQSASDATIMTRECSASFAVGSNGRTSPFSTIPGIANGRRAEDARCISIG